MFTRKSIPALGLIAMLGAPLAALADGFWETTNDEAGSRIVAQPFGAAVNRAAPRAVNPVQVGDISADRLFVFLGDESGWQIRPMEYRLQGGRLVHVDDPVGHMHRLADTTPLTDQQRTTLERSAGS